MGYFRNRIKELRLERGLSQQSLADKLGVNKQTISQYERGVREPGFETLLALCDFFNVSTDYLLGNESHTSRLVNTAERKMLDAMRGDIPTVPPPLRIPVLGRVAAGIPIDMIEDIVDWEELPASMASRGEYFGLVIHGDSMEPKMSEGDVIIVRKQDDIESGQIGIITVNGDDATCKRIIKHSDGIMLISTNPRYEPMQYTREQMARLPIRILGKVIELRAKFE